MCLLLSLCLFCFAWGCFFAPDRAHEQAEWSLAPAAEEIYNLLLLEQSIRSDDLEEVKRAARQLTELDPSEDTFVDAVNALMFRGEKTLSLEIARKAHLQHPESKRIHLVYAEAMMQAGRIEDGVDLLAAYAAGNPYDTHIIMRLAELFVRLKQFGRANEILNLIPADARPTELDPSFDAWPDIPVRKNPQYLYLKGKVLAGLNKLRDAEALLKQAVDKDPRFAEALAELAFLYENNKRPAEALEIYNRLLDLDSSNPSVWLRIIYSELQLGHADNAFAAVELGPPSLSFLLQAGQLFSSYKQWLLAERVYLKAAALPGADSEVFLYLFLTAMDSGNFDRAMNYLGMIPPESPAYERAVLYKLQAFSNAGRFDEAMQTVDEALQKFPAQKIFWLSKVSLYHVHEKYTEAELLINEALERFPADSELMFAQGALYDQTGRKDEALQVMEEIIQKYPNDSAALNYIGYTLADSGVELERARELILRALEGEPENPHIIDSLAWVQYRLGSFDDAYKNILRAIDFSPLEPEIWDHYGDIALKVNKPAEARKAYSRALELSPENSGEIQRKLDQLGD